MLNIVDLESRWIRHKIKSFLPYLVIFVSLAIIVIVTLLIIDNSTKKKITDSNNSIVQTRIQPKEVVSVQKNENTETEVNISEKKPSQIQTPTTTIRPSNTLMPSMDFMKNMQSSIDPYYEIEKDDGVPNYTTSKEVIKYQAPINEPIEELSLDNGDIQSPQNEYKENKINIQRQNTQQDISSVIKRFKKNSNPALSLFVAKKYYELADYHNAYNYALITNELNKDIDASWIIFSKALVKLGQKEKAIKTLKEYIKYSRSDSAKILLDEIESGQFK
ncbi:MAG: hypothetical protein JXQ67_03255 [Campylobacterales bacterium]|nr:hypothetical protein [Campylobacterales bacterium]